MGGYGSGRTGWRPVAERSLALDIGALLPEIRRVAALDAPACGPAYTIRWLCGYPGHTRASVSWHVWHTAPGALELELSYCQGAPISDTIPLDRSTMPNGAARWWYVCPQCERRAGVLYNPARYWRCRWCYRVTYLSSCESDKRIAYSRAAALAGQPSDQSVGALMLQLKALDRLGARPR